MTLKNFIAGMASTICTFPQPIRLEDFLQHYQSNLTPEQQDAQALAQNWEKVGQDIYNAMEQFEKEYNIKQN